MLTLNEIIILRCNNSSLSALFRLMLRDVDLVQSVPGYTMTFELMYKFKGLQIRKKHSAHYAGQYTTVSHFIKDANFTTTYTILTKQSIFSKIWRIQFLKVAEQAKSRRHELRITHLDDFTLLVSRSEDAKILVTAADSRLNSPSIPYLFSTRAI